MAEEEIIIKYKVDTTDFKQVGTAVDNVTEKIEDMGHTAKAAFSEAQIEQVTRELYEQGKVIEALIVKHGNAKKAMGEVNKELQTMALLGKQGTKEFKELEKVAAELTDTIGDTRDAVKRLASDTRTIDLVAQGVRGIAAGMSVAAGAAAMFGKENEDLQKAILKVQGALATMQGVQELATLATEKGGIAQATYNLIVGQSVGVMKAFRIALAATGIGLAVVGIAALVENWDKLNNAVREYLGLQPQVGKEAVDAQIKSYNRIKELYQNEIDLKRANGEDTTALELRRIQDLQMYLSNVGAAYKTNKDFVEFQLKEQQTLLVRQKTLEKQTNDERLANQKQFFDERKRLFISETKDFIDAIKTSMEGDNKLGEQMKQVGEEMAKGVSEGFKKGLMEKMPEATTNLPTPDLGADLAAQKFITEFADSLQTVAPTINAFADLGRAIFANETQALDEEKQNQLAIVGDNAKKREEIERRYAIKRAQLARQQAINDKAFAIFNAVVNLATSISKTIADNGFPAAIPFIALAAATGAAQIAAIAAAPLPTIPKFEKGGEVKRKGARALFGGDIRPDNMIIGRSHREGGVLIEAQGGEVINHVAASAKYRDELKAANEMKLESLIAHKYIAPAIENERRKSKATKLVVNNDYDDALLRKTIRDTSAANAHFVAKEVSKTITNTLYFKQRYQ